MRCRASGGPLPSDADKYPMRRRRTRIVSRIAKKIIEMCSRTQSDMFGAPLSRLRRARRLRLSGTSSGEWFVPIAFVEGKTGFNHGAIARAKSWQNRNASVSDIDELVVRQFFEFAAGSGSLDAGDKGDVVMRYGQFSFISWLVESARSRRISTEATFSLTRRCASVSVCP